MGQQKPPEPPRTELIDATEPPDAPSSARVEPTRPMDPAPTDSSPATTSTAHSDHEDLPPGTLLRERFRIVRVLGRGGMGTVYEAVDLRKEEAFDHDTAIALKVLKPGIVDAEITFMALQREARRAQQLAHPNIVTVFDFDRADDVVFMTMEFMRGRGLDSLVEQGPLEIENTRRIGREIARGLAYAHKRGIVHSDLKPENVFVLDDGRVKILDFGIARAWQAEQPDFVEAAVAGCTPAYASPQVLERQQANPADDVYALGLVILQMASGRHPFDWHSGLEARQQKMDYARPPGLRRREWRSLRAATAFERGQRPQDGEAFLRRFMPSTARMTAWLVAAAAVLAALAYSLLFTPEAGPEVPFDQLPAALQNEILRNLDDARLFLQQGDLNTALQLYDMVLKAHPGNRDAVSGIDTAVRQALVELEQSFSAGQFSADQYRSTLRSLLDYGTLPAETRSTIEAAATRLD